MKTITRLTVLTFAATLLAGCGNSSNSPSPTGPGNATATSVQVTRATIGIIASAHASGGGPLQMDDQNESFVILNETLLAEEVSAGAASTGGGRSASAAATMGFVSAASWEAPGVLSSLNVDFVGGGEGSTSGEQNVSTNAVAGISGHLDVKLIVPAGGITIEIEQDDRIHSRIRTDGSSTFNESFRDEGKTTFLLPAGEYTLSVSAGGGVSFTDSPHGESDAIDASVKLRFLTPTP